MNAKEIADLTGISVRTLHHYDQIGLLCPSRNPGNGYREYSEEDVDILQQILFFRQCGFSLSKIQSLISSSEFNRSKAFEIQRNALEFEKKRIEKMIALLDKTVKHGGAMTMKEKLEDFDFTNNPYEEEAIRLWGKEKVEQSKYYILNLSKQDQDEITNKMNQLFKDLAKIKNEDPESEIAQREIDKMYEQMNANFGYHYSIEAFKNLGQMYVSDQRFTKNIDKYGEGLALFLSKAMLIYANNK